LLGINGDGEDENEATVCENEPPPPPPPPKEPVGVTESTLPSEENEGGRRVREPPLKRLLE